MSVNEMICLITGGARGLGKGFAEVLLSEGAKVIIIDLLKDVGKSTEDELNKQYPGKVLFYEGCVTNAESINRIWEDAEKKMNGKVNVLVNNAGVAKPNWKKLMNINLMSVMELSYMAIEKMSIQNGGSGGTIINIASMYGLMDCEYLTLLPYFVSKSAVISFTKSLASSNILSSDGIRIGALCPYYVKTDMANNQFVHDLLSKEGREFLTVEKVAQDFLRLLKDTLNGILPNGSLMKVMPHEEAIYISS